MSSNLIKMSNYYSSLQPSEFTYLFTISHQYTIDDNWYPDITNWYLMFFEIDGEIRVYKTKNYREFTKRGEHVSTVIPLDNDFVKELNITAVFPKTQIITNEEYKNRLLAESELYTPDSKILSQMRCNYDKCYPMKLFYDYWLDNKNKEQPRIYEYNNFSSDIDRENGDNRYECETIEIKID